MSKDNIKKVGICGNFTEAELKKLAAGYVEKHGKVFATCDGQFFLSENDARSHKVSYKGLQMFSFEGSNSSSGGEKTLAERLVSVTNPNLEAFIIKSEIKEADELKNTTKADLIAIIIGAIEAEEIDAEAVESII